jgi:glyoxylase-like metal-dependent hydrolase (beta-lactamase superfamily II)
LHASDDHGAGADIDAEVTYAQRMSGDECRAGSVWQGLYASYALLEISEMSKMSKTKKIWIIVSGVTVFFVAAGAVALNAWRRSLGEVKVPTATELNDSTYRFTDGLSQTQQYLVVGTTRALLIDTGNGLNDLPVAIEEITDLPVVVVNTHGHFDHTHGNHYFDEVYLSVRDDEVYRQYNTPEVVRDLYASVSGPIRWLTKYEKEAILALPVKDETLPLPDEGYFDLGDRKIEIVNIPGHTPGSIGLIDRKEGALFAGDMMTMGSVLMQLREGTDMSVFRDSLRTLEGLAEEGAFSVIYGGHAEPVETSYLSKYDKMATDLLDGDVPENVLQEGVYEFEGSSLSFDPAKLR